VQGEDVVSEAAAGLGEGSWGVESSPEERAWVVSEGVEVEVVNGVRQDAAGCLRLVNGQLASVHVMVRLIEHCAVGTYSPQNERQHVEQVCSHAGVE
jgi:hypothetical protein